MAFSRHTVGDQSPSERLCLYPDSGSLTRARNLVRGSHLDVLSATLPCVQPLGTRLGKRAGWAFYIQVAVPMWLPDGGQHPGTNPDVPVWVDPQSDHLPAPL
jgi:hypothetical protein